MYKLVQAYFCLIRGNQKKKYYLLVKIQKRIAYITTINFSAEVSKINVLNRVPKNHLENRIT